MSMGISLSDDLDAMVRAAEFSIHRAESAATAKAADEAKAAGASAAAHSNVGPENTSWRSLYTHPPTSPGGREKPVVGVVASPGGRVVAL